MKKLVSIAASLLIAFAPLTVIAASPSTSDNGGSYTPAYDPCATSNPALAGKGCLYIVNGQIVTANGDGTFTTSAGNVFDANGRLVRNIYTGQGAVTASQYTFRFNHDFNGLVSVYVDGKWVDPSNYDAWSGSTVIQLKQSFINTLSEGVHTLTANWADGTSMSQQFTVSRSKGGVPNTGESDNTAYYVMMGGALIVMAGAGYVLATNK